MYIIVMRHGKHMMHTRINEQYNTWLECVLTKIHICYCILFIKRVTALLGYLNLTIIFWKNTVEISLYIYMLGKVVAGEPIQRFYILFPGFTLVPVPLLPFFPSLSQFYHSLSCTQN